MADRLAIVNWDLDTLDVTPPETGDWLSYYPERAQPFLTDPGWLTSPHTQPSIQYRDAGTGALLAVHPYPETPLRGPDGIDHEEPDFAYGPSIGPDRSIYLCGWNTAAVWRLDTNGGFHWRLDGRGYDPDDSSPPPPDFSSFTLWPLVSPDGSVVYVQNNETDEFTGLSMLDGAILSTLTPASPATGRFFGGMCWYPDGRVLFSLGAPAPTPGLYLLDLDDGSVSLLASAASISAMIGTYTFSRIFQIIANPEGDGFAFTIHNTLTSPIHSTIVEMPWDAASVTNNYTRADEANAKHLFSIAYSSDGTYIYSIDDTGWSFIYRFTRGPGNVGGSAVWMNADYATMDDWALDGYTTGFTGDNGVWLSVMSGIAVFRAGALPLRQYQRADGLINAAPRLLGRSARLPGPNAYR